VCTEASDHPQREVKRATHATHLPPCMRPHSHSRGGRLPLAATTSPPLDEVLSPVVVWRTPAGLLVVRARAATATSVTGWVVIGFESVVDDGIELAWHDGKSHGSGSRMEGCSHSRVLSGRDSDILNVPKSLRFGGSHNTYQSVGGLTWVVGSVPSDCSPGVWR
jgi:hypothetical protein